MKDKELEDLQPERQGLYRYRVAGRVRSVVAPLAKCRRYAPHVLLVLVACMVSWVLSEWYVEGAFKPLPYFIHQLYVWHFVVVR